jgi:hypothetical protein
LRSATEIHPEGASRGLQNDSVLALLSLESVEEERGSLLNHILRHEYINDLMNCASSCQYDILAEDAKTTELTLSISIRSNLIWLLTNNQNLEIPTVDFKTSDMLGLVLQSGK